MNNKAPKKYHPSKYTWQTVSVTLLLLISSCSPQGGQITSKIDDYDIKTIDSCEYIEYSRLIGADAGVYSLTHKGNCRFCEQRRLNKGVERYTIQK